MISPSVLSIPFHSFSILSIVFPSKIRNKLSKSKYIWKGRCTADTDSKVYNISSVGPSSERNRKWLSKWKRSFPVSLWRRANARNVRLYYPYRQWHRPFHISINYISTLPTQHTLYVYNKWSSLSAVKKCYSQTGKRLCLKKKENLIFLCLNLFVGGIGDKAHSNPKSFVHVRKTLLTTGLIVEPSQYFMTLIAMWKCVQFNILIYKITFWKCELWLVKKRV